MFRMQIVLLKKNAIEITNENDIFFQKCSIQLLKKRRNDLMHSAFLYAVHRILYS